MKHKRVPRVRRMEYLLDFLNVVKQGYDSKIAEQKLAERKKLFEIEKSKALGRGRPFMEKLWRTESLRSDCRTLSIRLGFARPRERFQLELTEDGNAFINANYIERRKALAQGLLNTHTAFPHVLLTIAKAPGSELDLPMKKDNKAFIKEAISYGLEVNQTDFEIISELVSQLELANWFPFKTDLRRFKRAYLTSLIYNDLKTVVAKEQETLLHFQYLGKDFWIAQKHVNKKQFKKVLWEEYLASTKYVPKRPVFYSLMRSYVCYKLRISDRVFDTYVKEVMKSDDEYRLVGSGGSLPYSRDMASLLKSLPLRTEKGEYIIYLKMDIK